MFLEEFYYSQDVDWLVKSLTAQAVSQGMSMPSDYRAAKSVILYQNNSPYEIQILNDSAQYDSIRAGIGDSTTGVPVIGYANHNDSKFYFAPSPSSDITMDLYYYQFPSIPDPDTAGEDSSVPTWGMPYSILIDMIKARAMEYNDDARQDAANQMVMGKIAQAKLNNRDNRAGSSRMKMGKRFRKRF